ncbi:MAG: hypothetical protein Q8S35_02345 [bacterium]|nr:hypothetical protein [bacterium]
MTTFRNKAPLATLLLGSLLLVSCVVAAPQTARAADYDSPLQVFNSLVTSLSTAADRTLNYILNGLAWDLANLAIESMTKSTVNWINSGFQGSPAFVTDLRQNMRGVADTIAGRFFDELSETNFGRSPFQDRVLDAVRLGYYLRTSPESFYVRYPYTLNQVSADDRAFLRGDFNQGGFNAWFATVMYPENNPYGMNILLNEQLENRIGSGLSIRSQELDWSRGFLSWRGDCIATAPNSGANNTPVNLTNEEPCIDYEVLTPGSVIQEGLNKALGAGQDRLVVADDFNEIISALLNQLVGQVLGGNSSGGLRGVSRPATGGGSSFLDRSTDPTLNPGNSANTGTAFAATIAEQRSILERHQASWERIRGAAQAALSRCGPGGEPNPEVVVTRAQDALVKAANGIAAYRDLEERIAATIAAGGNQTAAITQIVNDFTALGRSAMVPTSEEIAEAQIQAQDTGDIRPGSLYSQMSRQAAGSCLAGSSE